MNEARAHRVYVKQLWAMDWEEVTNLFAEQFTFCVAPEMPEAILSWNYGTVQGYDATSFGVREPKDLLDWYVKIELDKSDGTTRDWYGIIKEDMRNLRGGTGLANLPSGVQMLRCWGMEYLLMRKQITSAWVMKADATEYEIQRSIGFNLGGGDETRQGKLVPNMSLSSGTKGVFIFTDSLSLADRWTAKEICEYLLVYQPPQDPFGGVQVPFEIDSAYNDQLASLDWWKPALQCQDRTLKEVLDAIMDRRRLVTYRCVVTGSDVLIQPVTMANADIVLEGGFTVKANPSQVTLNLDDEARIKSATVVIDAQPMFDVVIAKGERAGAVWTMEYFSGSGSTLSTDWTTSLQTLYNSGSTEAASTADYYLKTQLHRNYRATDKFASVYRHFRVPADWDGRSTRGKTVVIDTTQDSPSATSTPAPFWQAGLRFEPFLPLRQGVDYTTVTAEPSFDVLSGSRPEYRRPFAVHDKTGERAWYLDRTEAALHYGDNPETGNRQWAATVRPQNDSFGIVIDVQGAAQHVIAIDEFTAADDADEVDAKAEVSWHDLYVTGYMLLDAFAQAQWPNPTPPVTGDVARQIVIDIPGKHLDYLVPQTIVEVDDAGDVVLSDGGWIRDDRNELKAAAKLMHAWYSTERRSLDITQHTLDSTLTVGDMITTIGTGNTALEVNSVVTQMMFDTRSQTLVIRTQFAELDVRGML